ncbi:hypothetical protein GCM10027521_28130 [Amycolatopsis cihanbeyliensis]
MPVVDILAYMHGLGPRPEHPDHSAVRFNIIPEVGELSMIPTYTLSGTCDILFFEGIPCGPWTAGRIGRSRRSTCGASWT